MLLTCRDGDETDNRGTGRALTARHWTCGVHSSTSSTSPRTAVIAARIPSRTAASWEPADAEHALASVPAWAEAPPGVITALAISSVPSWEQAVARQPDNERLRAWLGLARPWASEVEPGDCPLGRARRSLSGSHVVGALGAGLLGSRAGLGWRAVPVPPDELVHGDEAGDVA